MALPPTLPTALANQPLSGLGVSAFSTTQQTAVKCVGLSEMQGLTWLWGLLFAQDPPHLPRQKQRQERSLIRVSADLPGTLGGKGLSLFMLEMWLFQ